MAFSKDIHILQHKIFDLVQMITITLYILISFGLSTLAPQYLSDLQKYFKIYISLFLIYRFNMFRKVEFTDLDRKIAFDAGVFLIGSDLLNYILIHSIETIKNYISTMYNRSLFLS